MNEPATDRAATATVRTRRGPSLVWIVPIVALLIGAWLGIKAIREQGPTITITFAGAEGLEAGKTRIRYRDVEVGQVEAIGLTPDLTRVQVTARMVKNLAPYLTEETRFWVVRPRISGGSVSGLGTVLSGAYIGVDVGHGGQPSEEFTGLEVPPVVTVGQPGRHFRLTAESLGSLDIGAPVYFRQIRVGQVVGYGFGADGRSVDIQIFVEAPHHTRVTENSRFWNASGIEVSLGAQGLKVDTQSMVSILSGGIAFDLPHEGEEPGDEAAEDASFRLYENRGDILEKRYTIRTYWLLLFDESVRGLSVGAPVELFGIKVGEVVDLDLEFDTRSKRFQVPVLVAIEPERIRAANREEALQQIKRDPATFMKVLVEERGLRAQLQSGNLLTGQLMVSLVFVPDAPRITTWMRDGHRVVPTVPGQFQRLQESLTRIVARIEQVPFDRIGAELAATLVEARQTLQATATLTGRLDRETAPQLEATLVRLEQTLAELQAVAGREAPLPAQAGRTLEELSLTLRALRDLADTLEHRPQSLIFGKEPVRDE
jgi:paraquat-inducible protein B